MAVVDVGLAYIIMYQSVEFNNSYPFAIQKVSRSFGLES